MDITALVQSIVTVVAVVGGVFAYRWSSQKIDTEATEKITLAAKNAVDLVNSQITGVADDLLTARAQVAGLHAEMGELREQLEAREAELDHYRRKAEEYKDTIIQLETEVQKTRARVALLERELETVGVDPKAL